MPNITGTGLDAGTMQDGLLEEAGVAAIAGTSFGAYGEGYLRLSYAASTEEIEEAIARIEGWLARARRRGVRGAASAPYPRPPMAGHISRRS